MKEIIAEIELKTKTTTKVSDEDVNKVLEAGKDPRVINAYTEELKRSWGCDEVIINDIKLFIQDVKESDD